MYTGKHNLIHVVCREKLSGTYTCSKYDFYSTETILQRSLLYFAWADQRVKQFYNYGTDLMQHCTCEWHALECNPLSTKISSIHHRVRVDSFMKYARRKH